jgi:hypothetical protein
VKARSSRLDGDVGAERGRGLCGPPGVKLDLSYSMALARSSCVAGVAGAQFSESGSESAIGVLTAGGSASARRYC